MSFEYRELETTTFNNQRWYHVEGSTYYPSITTILGHTEKEEKKKSLESWRLSLGTAKADAFTKAACTRGTNVHLMIEQFLKNETVNVPGSTAEDKGIFNSLKLKLRKINEIYGQEVPLFSDVLGLAGRCDCIGKYEDVESIIDFKTTGRIKSNKEIEDYWLQCTFYALAHNEMFNTNIMTGVILMGNANGIPQVWKKDLVEYIEPLVIRIDEFYAKQIK